MAQRNLPSALMVAYHFPPQRGSSGIQRTLRFCRYLPEFGWQPLVLTANRWAYEEVSDDLMGEITEQTIVTRAWALNVDKHLSIAGRYPGFIGIPDRWSSWIPAGVIAGLAVILKRRPKVIWSTFPIPSAHVIGYLLHRITGLPWVADFRDPMVQADYPVSPQLRRSWRFIEDHVARRASRLVFTTPSARNDCLRAHPGIDEAHCILLENGYDEEAFRALGTAESSECLDPGRRLLLLHSGVVYTHERNPTRLIQVLGELKQRGIIRASDLEIRFRASNNDALLKELARKSNVEDLVSTLPAVGYAEALEEMTRADALLILQGASCNAQIPAKAYEYLRVGRPILGLTDPDGDTAYVLRTAGVHDIAALESPEQLMEIIPSFLDRLRRNAFDPPDPDLVLRCSRRTRTQELAKLFDQLSQKG